MTGEAQGGCSGVPVRGAWDLGQVCWAGAQGTLFSPTVPAFTFPLARAYLSLTPPSPGEVSGHLRPSLNAEPHSVSFAGRELLVGAPSVREGALPT